MISEEEWEDLGTITLFRDPPGKVMLQSDKPQEFLEAIWPMLAPSDRARFEDYLEVEAGEQEEEFVLYLGEEPSELFLVGGEYCG